MPHREPMGEAPPPYVDKGQEGPLKVDNEATNGDSKPLNQIDIGKEVPIFTNVIYVIFA